MFKILIPTDFSSAALKATEYGLGLAAVMNAEVVLFHATGLPMLKSTEDAELLATRDLERMENEQLAQVKLQMKRVHPEVIVSVQASTGFPVEEIKNACISNNINLVVMGTRGAGGLKEILVGSNTGSLIQATDCPVLAVPEQAKFTQYRHIVFATNRLPDDVQAIKSILAMFGNQQPQLTLLHIEDGHKRDAEAEVSNWFRTEILPAVNYPHIRTEVIAETDVISTLHSFLDERNADLLVTATRKRNLIEKIFDRSITRKLVYHTHLPLLALHTHSPKGEMIL